MISEGPGMQPMIPIESGCNKKHYATIGPIPLPAIALAYAQLEEQGWTVRTMGFAGMIPISQLAVGNQLPVVPAYVFVLYRELADGEVLVEPTLKIAGMERRN